MKTFLIIVCCLILLYGFIKHILPKILAFGLNIYLSFLSDEKVEAYFVKQYQKYRENPKSFSGYIWPELLAVHPDVKPIERTSMNSWEDAAFVKAVEATGRKKLIISALWTEVCLTFPALMALEAGYEVYVVTDTSGGTSVDAHERSIDRMVQAGAVPVTWQQVLLEYQRDWSRKETYDAVMDLVREHSGAYGMGVDYAYTMVHGAPERKA